MLESVLRATQGYGRHFHLALRGFLWDGPESPSSFLYALEEFLR